MGVLGGKHISIDLFVLYQGDRQAAVLGVKGVDNNTPGGSPADDDHISLLHRFTPFCVRPLVGLF